MAAEKKYYQLLEVSAEATPEEVRAAWERLTATLDAGKPEQKARLDAINEAFETLSVPLKRARYDMTFEPSPEQPALEERAQAIERFWTLPKLAALAVVVLIGSVYYQYDVENEARMEAEKAAAAKKVREAAERVKAAEREAAHEKFLEADQYRQAHEASVNNQKQAERRRAANEREVKAARDYEIKKETIKREFEAQVRTQQLMQSIEQNSVLPKQALPPR